jgi:hypothetical protein
MVGHGDEKQQTGRATAFILKLPEIGIQDGEMAEAVLLAIVSPVRLFRTINAGCCATCIK